MELVDGDIRTTAFRRSQLTTRTHVRKHGQTKRTLIADGRGIVRLSKGGRGRTLAIWSLGNIRSRHRFSSRSLIGGARCGRCSWCLSCLPVMHSRRIRIVVWRIRIVRSCRVVRGSRVVGSGGVIRRIGAIIRCCPVGEWSVCSRCVGPRKLKSKLSYKRLLY